MKLCNIWLYMRQEQTILNDNIRLRSQGQFGKLDWGRSLSGWGKRQELLTHPRDEGPGSLPSWAWEHVEIANMLI